MFGDTTTPEVGQRLGIQYVRTLQPTISVNYGDKELHFHQESMGLMAISGVVWDAGLLMVDYLCELHRHRHSCTESVLGRVLDIGCGTGIAGISALVVGSEKVLFTDIERLDCFNFNVEQLPTSQQDLVEFELYKWNEDSVPSRFLGADDSIVWDTVLCSDLLYEVKSHAALLSVLKKIRFRKAIFSYKKRHDEPEKAFFSTLASWCAVRVVDTSACITSVNLSKSSITGLYIVVVEPHE